MKSQSSPEHRLPKEKKEKGNFPDVLIIIWCRTNHGSFLIDVRLQVFCGSAEWYSDLGTSGPAECGNSGVAFAPTYFW